MLGKPTLTLSVAVALLTALGSSAAAAGPLGEVVTAASPLARLDDSMDGRSWDDVSELVEAEKNCQSRIDAALASGIKVDQEFEMEELGPLDRMPQTRSTPGQTSYGPGHGPHSFSNLGLFRKFCRAKLAKVQLLRTYLILDEAYQELSKLRQFGASVPYAVRQAAGRQRACVRELKRALEAGNDPGIRLGIQIDEDQGQGSERNEMRLGDAQRKICDPLLAQLGKMLPRWKSPETATKYAALRGDRAKVFEDQALWLEPAFGKAKAPLDSPESFQSAPIWHVVLFDRSDFGGAGWILRSNRFDGDKLVETKELRGDGTSPPDEAFH